MLTMMWYDGRRGFVAVSERDRYAKYCLFFEIVELISGGRKGCVSALHLPFRDHVHNRNAGQKDPRTAKGLEARHGPRSSLDRPMVLFD